MKRRFFLAAGVSSGIGSLAAFIPRAARGDVPAGQRVVEFRSYNLKAGTAATFERLFVEEAGPMLDRWGVDVVAFGRSLHDEHSWYLVRAFDGAAERETQERAFYGSEEWRNGPRAAVLDCIESYTTIVLPFDETAIAELRRALQAP